MDPKAGNTDNPQRLNRFSYSLNDPLNLVDPDGRDPLGFSAFHQCMWVAGNMTICYTAFNPGVMPWSYGNGLNGNDTQQAEGTYIGRVHDQWDANQANALLNAGNIAAYKQWMKDHPNLEERLQVNSKWNFKNGPWGNDEVHNIVEAFLKASKLWDLLDKVKISEEGFEATWKDAAAREAGLKILEDKGSLFTSSSLTAAFHVGQVGGPPAIDHRSSAFGWRALQVVTGPGGIYADTDRYNPHNPVEAVLHALFEVLPHYVSNQ